MADLITTNVDDLARQIAGIQKQLKELPDRLQKKALRPATRAAGKELLKIVKDNTPVKSGLLKRSFKVRALKRSRRNKNRVGVRVYSGVNPSSRTFSGETFYGAFIEFGAPGAGIAPRGFVAQAGKQGQTPARQAFVAELRKRLVEVVAK